MTEHHLDTRRAPADGDPDAEAVADWARGLLGGDRDEQRVENVEITTAVTGPDGEPAGVRTRRLPMVVGEGDLTEEIADVPIVGGPPIDPDLCIDHDTEEDPDDD